jgi:hypothetical protein
MVQAERIPYFLDNMANEGKGSNSVLAFYQTDASGPGVRRTVGVVEADTEWDKGRQKFAPRSATRGLVGLDANQEAVERASKAVLERSGVYHEPIVTEIRSATRFWPAEDHHQPTSKRAVRIIATYSIERIRFLPRAKLNARRKTGRPVASTPNSWVAGAIGERNLVRNTVR